LGKRAKVYQVFSDEEAQKIMESKRPPFTVEKFRPEAGIPPREERNPRGKVLKEQIETIEFVDKYRGQLDTPGIFTFPRPAVFISFGRFEWQSMVNGSQKGEGLIKFRIVVENYADSYEGSVNQDLALDFLNLMKKYMRHCRV